ncbi:MAG: hypothetical protein R6V31_02965 [Halohasta sp.]
MAVTLGRTRAIGRTEIRRRWRSLRAQPAQLAGTALSVLFLLPVAIGLPVAAYFGGEILAEGSIGAPVDGARRVAVTIWLAGAAFGGFRGYTMLLDPDCRDGLLTTVSHGQLLAGLLAAEAALFGLPALLVCSAAGALFAAGAGAPLAAPALVVAAGILLSTGFGTGLGVVLVFKNAGVRSRLLARLRTLAFVVLFAAYMGVFLTQSVDAVLDPLYWLFAPTPVGWLGETVLLAMGIEASTLRAGSAFVVGVVGLPLGAPVLARLTAWLWYADGIETEHSAASVGTGRLAGLLPWPMVGVVTVDWARARRAPVSISYAIYPLFLLFLPIAETLETGQIGRLLPLALAACGPWVTGALFTLNVVGNEGSVLPSTLLAPYPGRALVGGHIAASTLIGLPLTGLAVAATGLASPLSGGAVATLTVGSLLVAATAGPIATGIGALLPRYEAVSVSRSSEAVIPSTLAFGAYSVVIGIVAAPLVVGHVSEVAGFVSIPAVVVAAVGIGVSTVVGAVLGAVSTGYAIQRVDRFQFD